MTDLRNALSLIRAFVRDRGWEPFHDPKNLAMAVASEAGELVAELRWVPGEGADEAAATQPMRGKLEDEAADVAITLLMFCDRVGIDLSRAIPAKLEKNALRYPVHLVFEEPGYELMPWAARRALDLLGRKISLVDWQALPLDVRQRLAGLGSQDTVQLDRVRALASGADMPVFAPPSDPPPQLVDKEQIWPQLSAVARHALHAYAARGKVERLHAAYDALASSGVSQSTK